MGGYSRPSDFSVDEDDAVSSATEAFREEDEEETESLCGDDGPPPLDTTAKLGRLATCR